MVERELPPVPAALSFIDCINRADVPALRRLMTDDHVLQVFDENPMVGRDEIVEAWHGYVSGFPRYMIHPHRVAEAGGRVAVLGHTTGSHLGLPDAEEEILTLIWVAEVSHGRLRSWRLMQDNAENRRELGLDVV